MSLRRKQLDEIYRLYSSGSRTQAELARDFGVSPSAISLRLKNYRQLPAILPVPGRRPVPDQEGVEADEAGRLYRDGIELSYFAKRNGYLHVSLGQNNQRSVHSLVCAAFHGPRPEGLVCRHLNDEKHDNRPANLKWGTRKENSQDAIVNGRTLVGERNIFSRLSEAQVSAIRRVYAEGKVSQHDLADLCGVTQSAIFDVVSGKTWRHLDAV